MLRQQRDELRRELRAISAQLAEHGEAHSDAARLHREDPANMVRPAPLRPTLAWEMPISLGSSRSRLGAATLAWEQPISSWEQPASSAPISTPLSKHPVFGVTDDVSPPPGSWGRQHELTALKERFAQLDRQIARLTPSDRSLILTPEP
jgi:hypothetical protein